jgi:hypothetical protein
MDCAICLSIINKKKRVTLKCQHQFHKECLKTWFQIENSCPVCKQSAEIINNDKKEITYYNNNKLHKLNGPALINKDGQFWYKNGLHP